MAKCEAPQKTGWLGALVAWLHSTKGGSSETELNELAVRPWKRPCASTVVTTVTPVTKSPSAWRRALPSKGTVLCIESPCFFKP
ncbi:hypothetical protein D3C71_1675230 [compost metagenome]